MDIRKLIQFLKPTAWVVILEYHGWNDLFYGEVKDIPEELYDKLINDIHMDPCDGYTTLIIELNEEFEDEQED